MRQNHRNHPESLESLIPLKNEISALTPHLTIKGIYSILKTDVVTCKNKALNGLFNARIHIFIILPLSLCSLSCTSHSLFKFHTFHTWLWCIIIMPKPYSPPSILSLWTPNKCPSLHYVNSFVKIYNPLSQISTALYAHGCGTVTWTMFQWRTSKEMCLSTELRMGYWWTSMLEFSLVWSCAGHYRCCDFMYTIAMSGTDDRISWKFFLPTDS